MTRYFTWASGWVEDETYSPDTGPLPTITVPEHEATDTGLLTANGDSIWRAPNPMGFGKDNER